MILKSKYIRLTEKVNQLETTIRSLQTKVKILECPHTTTHFEYTPDYYGIDSETHRIESYYREVCDNCGKWVDGSFTEEEMLKIKIERYKKRLDKIKN
jgi:hypothetical protein